MKNFNKIIKKSCILLFCILILIINVSANNLTIDNEAYWTFDNVLTDATGNVNNLVNNGANYITSGKINGAYNFDGSSDYMKGSNFNPNTIKSYNMWINPDSWDSVVVLMDMKTDGVNDGTSFYVSSTEFIFEAYDTSTSTKVSSSLPTTGQWTMVTAVIEGDNKIRLYYNGILQDTSSNTIVTYESDVDLYIGTYRSSDDYFYNGIIDEFSIWNREINITEISYLYSNGTPTISQQYPYGALPNSIKTDLKSFYNTSNIAVKINTLLDSNVSYSLNGASNITINKTENTTFNNPSKIISEISYPVSIEFDSRNRYCLEKNFSGVGNYTINLTTQSVAQYSGGNWGIATGQSLLSIECTNFDPLIRVLNLNLSDGNYNISFYAQYGLDIVKDDNLNFTIDTITPSINIFNDSESNSYFVDFTKKFNVSDTCLCSCKVITNGIETNCFNYTYSEIGDYLVQIIVNDTAGNIGTKNYTQRINPYYNITFLDFMNNITLSDYYVNIYNSNGFQETKNDTNGTVQIFAYQEDEALILGNYTITFIKDSFLEYNFTKVLNLTNAETTTQFNVNPAYIRFNIKNVKNNSLVNPGNYTVVINNKATQTSETFDIINNNTVLVRNNYAVETEVQLNLLTNETVLASYQLITPRQNITVDFYVTEKTTISQPFEVVDGAFLPIKNSIVSLYVYVEGQGFVLQSEKNTNDVGAVNFDMIPFETLYTVCNIYQDETICLNQITIDFSQNVLRLIHSQTLQGNTEELLDFITWSYSEVKTNTSSEMSFIFNDDQNVVDSFCMNVSRHDGNNLNHVGLYCQELPSGIIVQTFSLNEGEYLEYTFLYNYNNINSVITKIRSYYSDVNLDQLKVNSVMDLLFLIIYFGAIGVFLGFKNFEIYNIGVLSVLLVIYIAQAVLNENYINIGIWGFLAIKTCFLYFVRTD